MIKPSSNTYAGTSLGIISIFFWSTTVAISRSMTESLGMVTTASVLFTVSGVIGLIAAMVRYGGRKYFSFFTSRYLLICGGLFVVYEVCLYLALGLSVNRQQVLEVGLINYLWVPLVLLFSILIFKHKARWTLLPGIGLAFGGVVTASVYGSSYSPVQLKANLAGFMVPYLLALVCGISWALYSNLTKRLAGDTTVSAVPLFLTVTGIIMGITRIFLSEQTAWSVPAFFKLAYTVVFPTILAYTFWDIAMRTGNIVLVASLAYFIPLISTIISSIYLNVPMGVGLWIACCMVVAGAIICKFSVVDIDTFKESTV